MAAVAFDKYGLTLTDNHLPMGCLDQGLDILQIMRNIDIFVRRYNYNLNQQFFVVRATLVTHILLVFSSCHIYPAYVFLCRRKRV